MRPFNLEQLRTFVAVTDAGSLAAGAPQVSLSQSAVSEQLRKLEQHAGQALLVRSKAGVAPTAAGLRLLQHARQLLAMSEAAWLDLRGAALQGTLRLGVTDYFRPAEVAGLLARTQARHPGVRLQVTVQKSGDIEAGYARGAFDVGLTMRLPSGTGGGRAAAPRGHVLRREPLQWMGAAALPQAAPPAGDAPLRLLALPDTCALHQFTVALLRRRRIPFAVVLAASGVAGLQSALAAGLGVACLNASALCEGVQVVPAARGLPALPQARFMVLPPRPGESAFVQSARQMLVADFG
ncbi:LysR family transcriptional regulator [Acidovorax sp. NCPPB 4044]|uniref:LysR family transcriptional regulator n=1 Tax=Acidovorax sp. NCPPB 4044 TaxID=2940490 RepID=UPI0023047F88|nr:LysR family transcriptional regulator [Acidovorax sp. NCPPB 4044]MDA8521864.1 LysR family transcriptional regulator [Acidovorax sp. NCPPB 4044]